MRKAAIPAEEGGRLATLYSLDLLDSEAEERFDRIVRFACRHLGVPAAAVSLVDVDREWYKASQGIGLAELARGQAPGAAAIVAGETLVVPDLSADERFADSPLVTASGLRFYAAEPLEAPDGHLMGTLAVMDRQPRDFGPEARATLRDVAAWAQAELAVTHFTRATEGLDASLVATHAALMQQAHMDPLTRLWNRKAILAIAERELARARREGRTVALILADLDHFRTINDTFGRVTGNLILQEIAERMRASLRGYDSIGRFEGVRFLVVLTGVSEEAAMITAERLRASVSGEPMGIYEGELKVTVSVGVTLCDPSVEGGATSLVEVAEAALAKAKWAGCDRVELVQA